MGIPPHRSEADISIPADIAEEVLRVYGYGKIEPVMPAMPLAPLLAQQAAAPRAQDPPAIGRRRTASSRCRTTAGRTTSGWPQIGFTPQGAAGAEEPHHANPAAADDARAQPARAGAAEPGPPRPLPAVRDRARSTGRPRAAATKRRMLAGVSFSSGKPALGLEEHFRAIKGASKTWAGRSAADSGSSPPRRHFRRGKSPAIGSRFAATVATSVRSACWQIRCGKRSPKAIR